MILLFVDAACHLCEEIVAAASKRYIFNNIVTPHVKTLPTPERNKSKRKQYRIH